jgi:hypothetical protein
MVFVRPHEAAKTGMRNTCFPPFAQFDFTQERLRYEYIETV